jgi:hypothetical protein
MKFKPSPNPGPGEYELNKETVRSPNYSISQKEREIAINDKVSYVVNNKGTFSLKSPSDKSKITFDVSANPTGPGAYNVKDNVVKSKTQTFRSIFSKNSVSEKIKG